MRRSEGLTVLFPIFSCDLQRISVFPARQLQQDDLKIGVFFGGTSTDFCLKEKKKSFLASAAFVLIFISLFHSVTPQGIILLALPRCSRRHGSSSHILHPHAVS